MKKLILCLSVCVSICASDLVNAQTVEAEKTYQLTRKSKKGVLAKVDIVDGNYVLYYSTYSSNKKAKFEIYTFDKDFNFVSLTDEELTFQEIKGKYKWFNVKDEEYVVEGLSVEPSMLGTLVLKKKQITYSYDWLFWGYRKQVKVLEKVKPKTETGDSYFYHKHFEDDNTGDVYILVGEKVKKDLTNISKKMHILRFNKDCELISDLPLMFDYTQNIVIARTLASKGEALEGETPIHDMCFVFAPGQGGSEDPSKTNFTFVRFNNRNELVNRFTFNSPSPGWRLDEIIHDDAKDELYLYGPSAEGKDAWWAKAVNAKKYSAVQLMKISGGKMEYITSTNLTEFESKIKTPPAQKKAPAYEGKKFKIVDYNFSESGEFFVLGQNNSPNDKSQNYKDVVGFHFDNKGNLRSQYGIDLLETNEIFQNNATPQFLITGSDPNAVYWFIREIDGANEAGRLRTYARIGKINLKDATVGDFKTLGVPAGEKKPEYFLDTNYPYLESTADHKVVFFGADQKGKNIWFSRVKLD